MDTREQLEQIRAEAEAAMENAASLQELDAVRVKYLGKKGELTAVLKTMGKLSRKSARKSARWRMRSVRSSPRASTAATSF